MTPKVETIGPVEVTVTADADAISVVVTDDGVGLDAHRRRTGLGLRGIEERVKELQEPDPFR